MPNKNNGKQGYCTKIRKLVSFSIFIIQNIKKRANYYFNIKLKGGGGLFPIMVIKSMAPEVWYCFGIVNW